MNPTVNELLCKKTKWQREYETLRRIILDCPLEEEVKWGNPCYTYQGSNIVLIHGFKEYCALLFFKGALMDDRKGLLVAQSENVQAARQIRFRNVSEINALEADLKSCIEDAIRIEISGLKVNFKKTEAFNMPDELKAKLDSIPELKAAFEALTPGRQRAYLLYFSEAKQSKTRKSRIEKCMERILAGKGLND